MGKVKKKRLKIYEIDETNDSKFNRPLSYRHFRIIGWAALIISQIGVVLSSYAGLTQTDSLNILINVFSYIGAIMAPLFLIAAFSQVLTNKKGYQKLIFLYGGIALAFIIGFILLYEHFVMGLLTAIEGSRSKAQSNVSEILNLIFKNGYVAFNIFIDLLLCTLLTFFINYRPKKFFQGNLIYLFRSFAIIPILYEIASITLKIMCTLGLFSLPAHAYPLLTTKPPFAFLVFVAVALYVKHRERKFLRNGRTLKEFEAFLDTNTNQRHVSMFLIFSIIIASALDLLAFIFFTVVFYKGEPIANDVNNEAILIAVLEAATNAEQLGFSKTAPMLLIIPLLVFFNYRKTYPKSMIDTFIPLAGVALVAIVYIEGFFEVGKVFFVRLRGTDSEPTDSSVPTSILIKCINKIKNFIEL